MTSQTALQSWQDRCISEWVKNAAASCLCSSWVLVDCSPVGQQLTEMTGGCSGAQLPIVWLLLTILLLLFCDPPFCLSTLLPELFPRLLLALSPATAHRGSSRQQALRAGVHSTKGYIGLLTHPNA